MTADLGAVVLCYGPDAQDQVNRLVTELVNQGIQPGWVTIVLNPSGNDDAFGAPTQGISVIHPERNLGYAGGMNLGIQDQKRKGSSMLLLVTMDVHLESGVIGRLCEAARAAPEYGILGPELRWAGTSRRSWGVRWGATGAVEHVVTRPADDDLDGVVECDSIDGALVLIRGQVLREIGPLVDRFFMYFEETEFCLRAKRAGWKVGVVVGAVAEQAPGESRRPGAFNYLMARNGLEFAWLLAGRRGVAAAIWRNIAQSWRLLKMRFSPSSDDGRQRYATVSLAGLWLGVLAFFRHRWGPPPSNLPGIGDITFAG